MFQLFLMLVAVAISLLGGVLAISMRGNEDALAAMVMGFVGLLALVPGGGVVAPGRARRHRASRARYTA